MNEQINKSRQLVNLQQYREQQRQMTKKRLIKKQKPSDKTKLIMKAKKMDCHKGTITVDFKPCKKDSLYNEYKGMSIHPVFNNDRKHFTPTFVLKYHEHDNSQEDMMILHEKKVAEYTTEVGVECILVAKPRSKYRYCGVCKDSYEDYYEHVHSEQHRQQSRSSRYSRYINQLCAKFNPNLYKQQKHHIENQLQQLMFKYNNEEHNSISSINSSNKNKKHKKQLYNNSLNLKKQSSLSYSNINNRTTIILSSD